MADQERFCRGCGEPLIRHSNEAAARWGRRRYCTKRCFNRLHPPKYFHLSRGTVIEYGNSLDRIDEDIVG